MTTIATPTTCPHGAPADHTVVAGIAYADGCWTSKGMDAPRNFWCGPNEASKANGVSITAGEYVAAHAAALAEQKARKLAAGRAVLDAYAAPLDRTRIAALQYYGRRDSSRGVMRAPSGGFVQSLVAAGLLSASPNGAHSLTRLGAIRAGIDVDGAHQVALAGNELLAALESSKQWMRLEHERNIFSHGRCSGCSDCCDRCLSDLHYCPICNDAVGHVHDCPSEDHSMPGIPDGPAHFEIEPAWTPYTEGTRANGSVESASASGN